jgi:hypothetical protein
MVLLNLARWVEEESLLVALPLLAPQTNESIVDRREREKKKKK